MWPFLLGSGGVAYGFIGANTSRESRTKFMSYYRVTCMAGVMSSTIGELLIIHARTTPDRLYQYWYQFFLLRPATFCRLVITIGSSNNNKYTQYLYFIFSVLLPFYFYYLLSSSSSDRRHHHCLHHHHHHHHHHFITIIVTTAITAIIIIAGLHRHYRHNNFNDNME